MKFATCAVVLALLSNIALAGPVVIQPNEAASKDVFVYEGLPSFNFDGGGFETILSSGITDSGHDTHSFIQFDLSGVTSPIFSATLSLYVGSGSTVGFPFADPSASTPVTTLVSPVISAWTEGGVSWAGGTSPTVTSAQPTFGSSIASATVSGINQWIDFDVTAEVQSWLANPSSNIGFALTQQDVVTSGGEKVVAVYQSSSAANAPKLTMVPEPATALLGAGLLLMQLTRRRRFSAGH